MDESKCLSQQKLKKKMESLNCVNRELLKENCADQNMDVDNANIIMQEISNNSASKIFDSPNFSNSKVLKSEECSPAYQWDKLSSVFIVEEDNTIYKVSNETLFADHKDIDYQLANVENMSENSDSYDKKPNINVDYTRTSNVVSKSGGFKEINGNVIDDDMLEDVLVHQSLQNMNPKIKEELVNDEEVSVINESIIDIELHPVSKKEELPDIGENNMPLVDKSHSYKLPDNSNEEIEMKNVFIVHKPVKTTEVVQKEMKTNLQLQNEVQTLNWTLQLDLQIKLETNSRGNFNSRDYRLEDKAEECVNKHGEGAENIEVEGKNDELCQNLRNRKSKHTTDRCYVCEVCSKGFTTLYNLKIHKRIHTGDRPFGCSICSKAFITLTCLKRHKLIHSGEKTFGCSECGKVFTLLDALKVHKRAHTGDRPFVCNICGKAFKYLSNIQVHKVIHTGDRPFVCSICGKAFTHLVTLKTHKSIHTEERPFVCSICGKTFKQLSAFKDHKVIHTGDRPFGCSTCGKAFTLLSNLQRHNRIHTGDRPFVCSICGKAFTQQSSLQRHNFIHTGDRPFGCSMCGKTFTQHSTLNKHKSLHTGDKPFTCNVCGKAFTRHASLQRHKCIIQMGENPTV